MTLDSVASCALATRSYPVLLILAVLAGIAAFMQRDEMQMTLFGVAIVLAIIYYASRLSVISITSNGGDKILAPTKGMSRASAIEFIDAVEREKLK
jgi:hypothetical protein